MKKFVVGYLNCFDNEIKQKIVYANSGLEACHQLMLSNESIDTEEVFNSVEEMQIAMFNRDISLGVIEI